jgi:hypothetical protein
VVFFASAVSDCQAKKLFKLLYLLDVRHFQATGRTATGCEYAAGDFGPYPYLLAHEIRELLSPDLADRIEVEQVNGSPPRHIVRARSAIAFDDLQFSRRQLALIREILDRYGPLALEQINVGEVDNGAWARALGCRKHETINMEDGVPAHDPNCDALIEQSREYRGRAAALRRAA